MSQFETEEQQIEAIKKWWDQNGTATVAILVVGIGLYLGMTFWKSSQEKKAEAASVSYEKFVELVKTGENTSLDDTQKAEMSGLAETLIGKDRDGLYADLASFHLAKEAVEVKDYDKAATHLDRIIADSASEESVQLAQLRLAKVKVEQGKAAEALALLNKKRSKSFEAAYAEARGDILLAQSKLDEARTAYQAALTALESEENQTSMQRSSLIRYKMDSARVATVNPLQLPAGEGGSEAAPKPAEVKSDAKADDKETAADTSGPSGGVADSAENN